MAGESPILEEVSDPEGIRQVVCLAQEIWREHYPAVIGRAQVEYMLERFQSEDAIRREIAGGARYFLMRWGGEPVGYLAFKPEGEKQRMFLSKLYVRKDRRRRGLARRAVEMIEEQCRAMGLRRIYLAVNRYNRGAIAAYERMGFVKDGERVVDIGGGFVMDDWIMEKVVEGPEG